VRLLLVEDDLDLAALLRLVLGQSGYEVEVTDRVEGVVDRAARAEAVVTDGALLDGTADDVLAALEQDPRTASLPVVICSVRPDAVRHPRVVGRLRKPLDAIRLPQQLGELLAPTGPQPDPAGPPSPPTFAVDPAEALTETVALRQQGLQELEVRARTVGDAGAALLCGDLTPDLRERARVAAHRSIGLAGALGEHDLAEPAQRAEHVLMADAALDLRAAILLCEVAAELEDGARSRVDALPVRAAASTARQRAGGLVAIVDDDEVLVRLVQRRLERAGMQVISFGHGGQALRGLRERTDAPDVLLLDIDLPGLNGLTVLDGLVAEGILGSTHVVLATVHDNDAELARARAATASLDHLPKPYDLDRLVDLVVARQGS